MANNSLDKNKIKFLLLEGIHPSAVEVLRSAGYTQIETVSGALPDEELKARIADVHFLGIRSRTLREGDRAWLRGRAGTCADRANLQRGGRFHRRAANGE